MTLLDQLRKKYMAKAKCTNCGAIQEVSIPRGVTIEEFFKEKLGVCKECGCTTLVGHKALMDEILDKAKEEQITDRVRPKSLQNPTTGSSPVKITPKTGTWGRGTW